MGSSLSPICHNFYPSASGTSSYTPSHHEVSSPKILNFALLPHSIDLATRLRHKNIDEHHIKYNRHQVLLPGSLLYQSWRGANISRHQWGSFQSLKNAGSVHSDIEGGDNGLLCLVMCPSMYLIMDVLVLIRQKKLRCFPVIPDGYTEATTIKLVQHHKVYKTQFYINKSCDDALKQQTLLAFHNYYA